MRIPDHTLELFAWLSMAWTIVTFPMALVMLITWILEKL